MTYDQAVAYLNQFINWEPRLHQVRWEDFKLDRMWRLIELLGQPQEAFPSLHVAGTKGKGSTAAMMASLLQAADYRVGLFTSPHLVNFRERIRCQGEKIPPKVLAELVAGRLRPAVEEYQRNPEHGDLTFFELYTALAFLYFAAREVDFAVVEVGLGGRLDATNVLQPQVVVLTAISYDHTDLLGSTLTAIAQEKAGVIKPGVPVVCAPQPAEAQAVFQKACTEREAPLIQVPESAVTRRRLRSGGQELDLQTTNGRKFAGLTLPLLGRHQAINAAVAVEAVCQLAATGAEIKEEAVRRGLAQVNWPGRLQVVREQPWLVLDGAHNGASAACLRQALREAFPYQRLWLILGTSVEKDVGAIAAEICPWAYETIATQVPNLFRAASAEQVAAQAAPYCRRLRQEPNVAAALRYALGQAAEKDLVCVTGSLYLVGEALQVLGVEV